MIVDRAAGMDDAHGAVSFNVIIITAYGVEPDVATEDALSFSVAWESIDEAALILLDPQDGGSLCSLQPGRRLRGLPKPHSEHRQQQDRRRRAVRE